MKRFAGTLAIVLLGGCVASNSVVCSDGRVCPENTLCDETHAACISSDQLTSCVGKVDGDACTASTVPNGACHEGTCLPAGCGNGRVDTAAGEVCDDGNTIDGDGCSADCKSTEQCGNGIIDSSRGEQCDDGNSLEHDGCSSSCKIEAAHWIQHGLTPGPRREAAIAYDSRRDRVVLFGGDDAGTGTAFDDTWEWDGGTWIHIPAGQSPLPRNLASTAFDGKHVVLFGGTEPAGGILGDTWLWDGVTWTAPQLNGSSPSQRYGASMAYDSRRHRVVLFGGYDVGIGMGFAGYNDTWEWDGTTWTMVIANGVASSPPGRNEALMAYDPIRGQIVLTGGSGSVIYTDTWTYDGTAWTNVTATAGASPSVYEGAMAFDPSSGRVVAFGGLASGGTQSAAVTYEWNGATWTKPVVTEPPKRNAASIAQTSNGIVMVAGIDSTTPASPVALDESWLFSGGIWNQPKWAGARDEFGAAYDPVHVQAVVFSGGGATNDTWQLSPHGFVQRSPAAAPSARAYPNMAFDPVHGNALLFGGKLVGNVPNAETWLWTGTTWLQQTSLATAPGPRWGAAIAYDGTGITMFGGATAANPNTPALGDTWHWDGSAWTPIMSALPPPQRENAAAGYDPIRNQLVMFGGLAPFPTNSVILGDTWTFDGTSWTQQQPAVSPPARTGGRIAWNPARKALVLLGASNLTAVDAWEWNGTSWSPVGVPSEPLGRYDFAAASTFDGGGVVIYGGYTTSATAEIWELRWDGPSVPDRCDANDLDGDGLVRCADPDCWPICAPECPPGTSCPSQAPTCGDGICDPTRETCRTCPADCMACTPVCGDGICDPGETGCPGDCG